MVSVGTVSVCVCVVIASVGVRAMSECGGYVCVYRVVSDVLCV